MIYASRLQKHKTPFGAAMAGETVLFRLTPSRADAWLTAWLCVRDEFGGRELTFKCRWEGLCGDCDQYAVTLDTTGMLGPVWYWFRFERTDGSWGIVHQPELRFSGEGVVGAGDCEPSAWQLTVADPNGPDVPEWYGRGVTYHIFPDRFRRTHIPSAQGLPGNRTVHASWEDCPAFGPNAQGEVLNNDFFGGNIGGIREKLSYLQGMGVSTIYFSPVFEAASNHRYDTGDYRKIDPMFGTEEEFSELCAEAERLGMRIILDGVFNHTGFDSVYFNGRGSYDSVGAFQSQDSPYLEWYDFIDWPHNYRSWWGIYTLPNTNEMHPGFQNFIYDVVRHWLRLGASGWRLDVADELPGEFIQGLRNAAREEKPDAVIIGEVWEDASNKISYGVRRRYLLGHELDSVMNYPLRNNLISFILGDDAARFRDEMERLRENYPRSVYYSLMNALGTHDTPRILTVLGASPEDWQRSAAEQSETFLSPDQYALAVRRLKLASAILFSFPGSPCVYYGDEAGVEGFRDPFNRRTYPWGRENKEILDWYLCLGAARNGSVALQTGYIEYHRAEGGLLCFSRIAGRHRAMLCVNRDDFARRVTLPWPNTAPLDILSGHIYRPKAKTLDIKLHPMSAVLLI